MTTTEEKLMEWRKYIERLFKDNRPHTHGISAEDGINITRAELEHVSRQLQKWENTRRDLMLYT